MTRRTFLVGGSALAAVAGSDGLFLESRGLVVEHIDIQLQRLPKEFRGFRIAPISDLHFGPDRGDLDWNAPCAWRSRSGRISWRSLETLSPTPLGGQTAEPARFMRNRVPTYGQGSPAFRQSLFWGITITGTRPEWSTARWVSGIDDVLAGTADLGNALRPIPSSETTILIAHDPYFADYAAGFAVDLQLSGHSHGGQVRVPGIGGWCCTPWRKNIRSA